MRNIYTNVIQRFNRIFYRGYKDGKRIQTKMDYRPSLYIPGESTDYSSLFGKTLEKRTFGSIGEAKNFVKENSDIYDIHGNTRYEYAFIHEHFRGEQQVTLSEITVHSIDIETAVENGLSVAEMLLNPIEEVLLITAVDLRTKKLVTFGARPSTQPDYVLCKNEEELLKSWIRFVQETDPDIITGWNSNGFDISYLCSRICRVLGEEWMNKLSPFSIVDKRVENNAGRTEILYDIVGRTTLDMLELYKKFRFINRESYRLDFIAEVELGKNKVKNEYGTFRDHYMNGWNSFVSYNQTDARLVDELEDKLGMVYLAISIAYLCKINYSDVYSPVKSWEQLIQHILLERNVFYPLKNSSSSRGTTIEGGYVKEPITGFYKWIISFDFTSLYPKIAEAYNMSPETLQGMTNCNVEKILSGYKHDSIVTTLCANGAMFSKDKQGIIAEMMGYVFSKRKQAKDEMKVFKERYQVSKDEHDKKESDRLHVLQLALKVTANSGFGALANEYFFMFDNRIAEGITMTGQAVIRYVSTRIDAYLKKASGIDRELLLMIDTDSSFFNFGPFVEKYCKGKTDEEICKFLNKVIEQKIKPMIAEILQEFEGNTNAIAGKLDFKLEKIAKTGFITGKKRYAVKVLENEGIRYAEPEIAVTGIEVVRSSTPQLARKWLKTAIELILDEQSEELKKYVNNCEGEFTKQPVENISFPRSANNLLKYSDKDMIYTQKGAVPIGVRASLLYNHKLTELKLTGKYELIAEGNKMKFVYLKEPNTLRENVIAFASELPEEFCLHKYVDYNLQFKKVFLDPLENITTKIGWKLREETSLDDFFV